MAKNSPQDIENRRFFSMKLNELLILHGKKQIDLHKQLNIPKSTITGYIKGTSLPTAGNVQLIADFFGVAKSEIDLRFIDEDIPTTPIAKKTILTPTIQSIVDTSSQLEEKRQQVVLDTAKIQLEKQNANKFDNVISINSLKEEDTEYKPKPLNPVTVIESLAAGIGHSYSDENERFTVYTDRDDLANYHLASFISGDSMEPEYKNGDVALIRKGYDNLQGAVYAIDYNGKTFMKKLYNDGYQFRLVSINDKYDDILIDVPVDEDIYFNIVGRVVDSFSPLNKYGDIL